MSDICKCGHPKSCHIYEEGACRPGEVCRCKQYQENTASAQLATELNRLREQVYALREVCENLAGNCSCTVKERMSGHHVDCGSPHVLDILRGDDFYGE